MSISLNSNANNNIAKFKEQQSGVITNPESKFDVVVMPTNEEYMILKDTLDISQSLETNNRLKKVRKYEIVCMGGYCDFRGKVCFRVY